MDFIAPEPPNDLARIRREKKTNLVAIPGTRIITFQMNQERNPALADKRVRQAIVYAVNNKGIVKKIMKKFAAVAGSKVRRVCRHNPALKPRYDLAKAKALMAEAGATPTVFSPV